MREQNRKQKALMLQGLGRLVAVTLTLAVLAAAILPAGQASAASKKKAKLNYTSVTLCRYHSGQLKVKNTKKVVVWSSSDPNVASVDSTGTLTAKNPGSCTVTAKVAKKSLTCQVTVAEFTKEEILAGYGYVAAEQLLGIKNPITVEAALKGSFLTNDDFSYLKVGYLDSAGEGKNAYIYVYEQQLPEEWQAYMNTPIYGNLIIRVDEKEMDSMLTYRSKEMDLSHVKAAYDSLRVHEKLSLEKTNTFAERHEWIDL